MNRAAAIACVLLAAAVGCTNSRHVPPPDIGTRAYPSVDPPHTIGIIASPAPVAGTAGVAVVGFTTPADAKPARPKQILALSGGGMYGSFTAGVLNGWTKGGQRPEFDVISGISTGGLIAPLAFIGGADNDEQMKKIYTNVTRQDIFTYRNWVSIPFRDAIATTAPLRAIVAACMTDDVILKIAVEHRKGRRLYIGTTNLDTRRFVTWDLGAIATRAELSTDELKRTKKLVVDVLIASCSLPGIFPPVEIEIEVDGKRYTEMHADGGVISSVWVPPQVLDAVAPDPRKPAQLQPPAELYVVLAGKAYPDVGSVRKSVFDVLTVFMATAQAANNRREISNLYHMAKLAGVNFHMAGVPADLPTSSSGLDFDREEMGRLFAEGQKIGEKGLWWNAPPERAAGEVDPIRTGVKYSSGK
jgi:predicted acylesterase/phospholipase RssA